jgi:phosphoribosylaminoimidazolecarboxamide formyltransferase/IMP cyclohydrolase
VVVKHATPCGVAVGETITDAARRAYDADSVSAFGGIVVVNRTLDAQGAQLFAKRFLEVIAAPSYTEEALVLLAKKKNLRVIEMGTLLPLTKTLAPRALGNDLLLQEKDHQEITESMLTVVTERTPSPQEIKDLLFAWKVVKHVKSNAIVTATELTTCGIGGGQVSRVDATRIALQKSGSHSSMVLASDAFFPFRDSIDELKGSPVTAIIQPGGSIRDEEVIAACNEAQIAMVFTGVRSFLHG